MELIRKNIEALTEQLLSNQKSRKNTLSLLPETVGVLVVSKVIPSKKLLRLQLPHRATDLSICLLVKDTDKSDYNKSVDAWKLRWKTDASKEGSVTAAPTFLPLRELKLAYQPFASKERLAATFDLFLADRRIVHHLPTKLGKAFYGCNRGKIPVPVTLTNCNLVNVVEKERNTVIFQIRGLGTAESVPIGDLRMPVNHIKANALIMCEKICNEWPGGGLANIRSIYLQCPGGNIPLYFDASEAPLETVVTESSRLFRTKEADATTITTTLSAKPKAKRLTLELLSRVAEDVPLPAGGLEEILAKAKRKPKVKRLTRGERTRKARKP